MSSTQSNTVSQAVGVEETILEWRVHLAARDPLRAAKVVCVLALAVVVGLLFIQNLIVTLIMCFALFSSVAEFLLPIHYRLTTRGAYARHFVTTTFIEWRGVKKVYQGADGVKLSPLTRRSRLEAFRGVSLRFGDDNRERVLEEVRKWRESKPKKS